MKIDPTWRGVLPPATAKPTWKNELAAYESAKRAAAKPLDALFTRLVYLTRSYLELVTSPDGNCAQRAREMRPGFDSCVVQCARLCLKDEALLDSIGDADARRTVEAVMSKIKAREGEESCQTT